MATIRVAELVRRLAEELSLADSVVASATKIVARVSSGVDRTELATSIREMQALALKGQGSIRRISVLGGDASRWLYDVAKTAVASDAMDNLIEKYNNNFHRLYQLSEKAFGDRRSAMWGLGNQLTELGLGEQDASRTVAFLLRDLKDKVSVIDDTVRNMSHTLIQISKLVLEAQAA